jgi:hypothetical protein
MFILPFSTGLALRKLVLDAQPENYASDTANKPAIIHLCISTPLVE